MAIVSSIVLYIFNADYIVQGFPVAYQHLVGELVGHHLAVSKIPVDVSIREDINDVSDICNVTMTLSYC